MKKVLVAMSGGMDSSVAAALLIRAGFNVEGAFLKLYDSPQFRESEKRAKKVASVLGIPIFTLDLEKEFKKIVINYFIKEYQKGRTPNPCVICNKEIKFGILFEEALKLDFDFLATGHYARIKDLKLLMAKDKEKDQSYFLWKLNQDQLRHILFPVGDYIKLEAKLLAKKFGLPIYEAQGSQEICFVPDNIEKFLKKYIKPNPGRIIDSGGKIIGQHLGLAFYTIGQRKGIKIPSKKPYYVIGKIPKNNILEISQNQKDLLKKELVFNDLNWISGQEPKLPLKIKAKIRYRYQAAPATIMKHETWDMKHRKYKVTFDKLQRAITLGQSVVFYQGQELLGGGIICYNKK